MCLPVDGVGPSPVGPPPVGPHPVGPHPVGPHPVGPHPVGPHPVGPPPVAPRRDKRDYLPPSHHPAVNQAVDSYFDQYLDSVRHRQGNVGYPKQGYKNGRGMGYNAA